MAHRRAATRRRPQGRAGPRRSHQPHARACHPQSWEQHWPLDDSQDDPIGWRTSHLHKLGNLPLTTGALNASLSNGPWHAPDKPDDKRRGLANHSLLKLNTALANGYPQRFDERAIDERGKRLANIAIRIWPGPQVPATAPAP